MKISFSRQNIFLLLLTMLFLLFIVLFSFFVLIPKGKEYREQRTELRKVQSEVRQYEDFYDETLEEFKKLQSDNRHSVEAFYAVFNSQRFEKQHQSYFISLTLSKISQIADEDGFSMYEVNTTSEINSPKAFYDFLDAVNKSDWIISINFPINFKREGKLISSSFTMKVYYMPKAQSNQDMKTTAL